jgi:acyl-CoA thioesterase-1
MAHSAAQSVGAGLILLALGFGLHAQGSDQQQRPPGTPDMSLSRECRVPAAHLYVLAPLPGLKSALEEGRPVKVLALGYPAIAGPLSSSVRATITIRLEGELEKALSGVDIEIEQRGLPGETTAEAVERITNFVAEFEPDAVVWQVGTNDVLAKVEIGTFASALQDVLEWLAAHRVDAVLVEPPYAAALEGDDHYNALIEAIRNVAAAKRVPLVLRHESMRFLSQQGTAVAGNEFSLSDLGYRCVVEYIARTVALSVAEQSRVPRIPEGRDEPR